MRINVAKSETVTFTGLNTQYSYIDLSNSEGLCAQVAMTLDSYSAKVVAAAAVSAADDSFTSAAHGYITGVKGQLTTSNTLPAGLSTSTDYWLIVLTANTFGFASSMANAKLGTLIDITSQGVGNHTFTPVASAGSLYVGCTNTLSISNPAQLNSSAWTSGNNAYNGAVFGRYAVIYGTITSGTVTAVCSMVGKGDAND